MRYLPLLAILVVACAGEAEKNETPADAVTYSLAIEGMDCEGCVAHVKKSLEGVDGVADVTVDLKNNSATCVVKKSVKPDALVKAVSGDYKATLKP